MASKLDNLRRRGELLQAIRRFFLDRGFVEVETPLLADEVIPEAHIEPVAVGRQYLQASPELAMKRLLAAGLPAIFQITRAFRANEHGPLHRPEFTIVEWYRAGDDLEAGMALTDALMQAVAGAPPAHRTSYAAAFEAQFGLCGHTANCAQLAAATRAARIAVPQGLPPEDRDEWLNLLLATKVEPQLGRDAPELLYHYPATQAALAKTVRRDDGIVVAERFELYWQGVELANGYHELTDSVELRRRLEQVNRRRLADNRPALPLPESLLAAMQSGLPSSAGCALGFDRLAMLVCGANTIGEVIPGEP